MKTEASGTLEIKNSSFRNSCSSFAHAPKLYLWYNQNANNNKYDKRNDAYVKKRFVIRSGGYAYVPKQKKQLDDTTIINPMDDTHEWDDENQTYEIDETISFERIELNDDDEINADADETRYYDINDFDDVEDSDFEPEEPARQKKHKNNDKEPWFVERTKPRPFALRVILMAVFMLIVLTMGVGMAGVGVVSGVIQAYTNSTPELNISLILEQDQASLIYDGNGQLITSYMAYENREWAKSDEIPDMLKNAFIAVEDVRFYQHNGLDLKRLFSVGLGVLTNNYDGGGSTITQQLIKIQVLGNEQSYKRKIQEAHLAMELEKNYSKDQILEAYLNAIHLGGSNYGVKAAAEDYFGKSMDQLTIRECAMLAGLTQNPNAYNPRKNMYTRKDMTRTDERTNTVLRRMNSAGFITKEQYESALNEKVNILEYSKVKQIYDMPSFVEYAMYDVITHMLRQRNLQDNKTNRDMIEQEIRVGGYQIYTTVDPKIQNTVQETVSNWDNYPKLRNPSMNVMREVQKDGSVIETVQPQVAVTIIDYHTGQVKALVGRRDQATQLKLLNRAYNTRMEVGSSIKPLSVYAPALDAGASPASIYMNIEAPIEGYGGRGYPLGGLGRQGPKTMREGVVNSLNVVAARTLFETVGVQRSKETLENLGIDPSGINADGPGLALGTTAVSPLEMAAAYGTLANGGVYLEPVAFTKVYDKDGNLVLDSSVVQTKRTVFQPSTAWLMTDMLEEAVNEGTGSKAKIDGLNVAGKTGTNADYRSVYFAGYTPYYAASLWIGHDSYKEDAKLQSGSTGGTYAAPLWKAFMEPIHQGLANKPIIDKEPGQLGLVERQVCGVTGLLPGSDCKHDRKNPIVTDWFKIDQVPTETCSAHFSATVCEDTGLLASPNCPSTTSRTFIVAEEDEKLSKLSNSELKKAFGSSVITGIGKRQLRNLSPDSSRYSRYYCTKHSAAAAETSGNYDADSAAVLIQRGKSALNNISMSDDTRSNIQDAISQLEILTSYDSDSDLINNQSSLLEILLNQIGG